VWKKIDELIFSIQRWYYGEGRYFICLPPDPLHSTAIYEIVRGPYKGLRYCHVSLNIKDDGSVGFDIHYVRYPLHGNIKGFSNIARKILLILLEQLYNGDNGLQIGLKPGEEYEDRTSYIEEPDPKRTICKKGLTISEE
jgi:hypothetical protein